MHIVSRGSSCAKSQEPSDQTFLAAEEFQLNPLTMALNGGEDYELLFTIKQSDYEKIKNNSKIAFIGYMTNDPKTVELATKGGNVFPIQAQGWKHV